MMMDNYPALFDYTWAMDVRDLIHRARYEEDPSPVTWAERRALEAMVADFDALLRGGDVLRREREAALDEGDRLRAEVRKLRDLLRQEHVECNKTHCRICVAAAEGATDAAA
jgi:hypothetical protein